MLFMENVKRFEGQRTSVLHHLIIASFSHKEILFSKWLFSKVLKVNGSSVARYFVILKTIKILNKKQVNH